VIVRISTEGQYDLDETHHHELDRLDDAVVEVVEAGDESAYRERFDALLAFVRDNGSPHDDDDLHGSDFILPPPDLTFEEARSEFSGEGLIPDPPAA
jgi:hypothetical protein